MYDYSRAAKSQRIADKSCNYSRGGCGQSHDQNQVFEHVAAISDRTQVLPLGLT